MTRVVHQLAPKNKQGAAKPVHNKLTGAVYTPPKLASWVADMLLSHLGVERPCILDLGCGAGALLHAVQSKQSNVDLIGIDIDKKALVSAKRRLGAGAKLIAKNVLQPPFGANETLANAWVRELGRKPDAIIMNPPWGAEVLRDDRFLNRGLTVATSQFDTYDLFCELALQIVARGGLCAFILPDSLFLPQHEALRKLIAEKTTILFLARLGEGVFENVARGSVIIICRNKLPLKRSEVECVRLNKDWRNRIKGEEAFEAARRALAHQVPQLRFRSDPNFKFDIDVQRQEFATIAKIERVAPNWTNVFASRRGVELAKGGAIVTCECGLSRPRPTTESVRCRACNRALDISASYNIVSRTRGAGRGWMRLIVGEDVRRYSVTPSRWIRQGIEGINYKALPQKGERRLLIRKTGIGLNAALDDSGALTNQVVFEYKPRSQDVPDFYLPYALGVLCSRTMLAYHLKRSGDNEWRSHPYVTQRILSELPVYLPSESESSWKQCRAIAAAVERHISGCDQDLLIEGLVAGLFKLTAAEFSWIAEVLDSAGNMEAMRMLRLPSEKRVVPVSVL